MIYVTGDCHGEFTRFMSKQRNRLPFELNENDYMIVCGDFGLLWERNKEFEYNLDWLSRLPFTLLWVQGNHENYDMIEEYPLEEWHGGKVRHIVRDKIMLLERGQIFNIERKTFFTFGGASSHDIQGGVLDKNSPTYMEDYKKASRSGQPFRVLNVSWWSAELPSEEELQAGRSSLNGVDYKVDYVISHCASNRIQDALERYHLGVSFCVGSYKQDILTNFFEELEDKLQFKRWFCGHYHEDLCIDEKHRILYCDIIPIEEGNENDV